MIVQCATFSKSQNPRNIKKSVSDIRIHTRFPFKSRFWISVSGCKLTILPDICCNLSAGIALNARFTTNGMCASVEWIEDFCDPNPVQYFQCVMQFDPNLVTLSKYLIQSGLYPKKLKHSTAVINVVWTSISDPVVIFSKSSPIRIRF